MKLRLPIRKTRGKLFRVTVCFLWRRRLRFYAIALSCATQVNQHWK